MMTPICELYDFIEALCIVGGLNRGSVPSYGRDGSDERDTIAVERPISWHK